MYGTYWISIIVCVLITAGYPYIIAKVVPNTIVMPAMDHQCFVSSPGVHANYMNIGMYDKWDENILRESFKDVFTFMPKFRYKIKEIAGDYYYEEMSM